MKKRSDVSRRTFLQTVGVTVPTLQFVGPQTRPATAAQSTAGKRVPGKFTPIDLSAYFNSSSTEFGPRERARQRSAEISMGPGGGSVEVEAEARCFVPLHRLEILRNGEVAFSTGSEGFELDTNSRDD